MSTSVFGRRPSAGVKGRFLLRRAVAVLTTSVAFLALGAFFSVQQLAAQTLDQSHYRWRNDDGGEEGAIQVSAIGPDTTAITSYVLVPGMTITPGAGDYLVWFSGTVSNDDGGGNVAQHVSLFLDGGQILHTEREMTTEQSIPDTPFVVATHAFIPGVTAGQAITVRWQTAAGTATMLERTLTVTKVSSSDVTQATATGLTTETSTSYTLINSMTLTPGAGDYLIWFSGSSSNIADPTKNHVSLYVNNTPVAHTEREIDQEESLGDTFFPVALHARVTGVGAGQAIEVRWKVDSVKRT